MRATSLHPVRHVPAAMVLFTSVACIEFTDPSGVREKAIGTQVLNQATDKPGLVKWANGTELLVRRHWDWPYTDPRPGIEAIDVNSRTRRAVAPAPADDGFILSFEVVPPFVYYLAIRESTWTLRRVPISGGEPQVVLTGDQTASPWAVSTDHRTFVYATPQQVVAVDMGSGKADTLAHTGGADRIWVSPDGAEIVTLVCCMSNEARLRLLNVASRQVVQHALPSFEITSVQLPAGPVVRWEQGTVAVYYVSGGSGVRYQVGAGMETRASAGGEGAWSPALDRIGGWQRRCMKREPAVFSSGEICVHSEHDLTIGLVGGSPRVAGTIVSREPDRPLTSPPVFSPDNAFVAYFRSGDSEKAGIYVVAVAQ
jgi:hypothetical protein